MKKLLNVDEVSELLGTDRQRTYGLARLYERTQGKQGLPVIRLGLRQMRFSRSAIERVIEGENTFPDSGNSSQVKEEVAGLAGQVNSASSAN